MNCAQADELIAAYALDALPEGEAADLRAHIATCADHAARTAELRDVASGLATLADPVAPPQALRARILDEVRATPQDRTVAAAPRPITREPAREARTSWNPFGGGARYAWGALAAVVVAAVGGLLAWNIVLMRDGDGGAGAFASGVTAWAPLQTSDGESTGVVVYFGDEHRAVLLADGLPQLDPASNTYQLWSVRGSEAVSLGLMQADANGHASLAVPFDASSADAFAITVEPPEGSPQPTGDPVYVAEL